MTTSKIRQLIISLLLISGLASPLVGYAHPGNTASDGCHYCRTNCTSWGEVEGARHCHGGSTSTNYFTSTTKQFVEKLNGKTYYSESEYNAALEEDFQEGHASNVRSFLYQNMGKAPTTEEVAEWASYSRDLAKVEAAIVSTDEYKQYQFEKEHSENIELVYQEIHGSAPTDQKTQELEEYSDDIIEVRRLLEEEAAEDESVPNEVEATDQVIDEMSEEAGGFGTIVLMLVVGVAVGIFTEKKYGGKRTKSDHDSDS